MISIEFFITSLVVVLIPGTGVLYTVAAGLFIGKRASLVAAIGCTFGIVPSLLACVLGLAAIFHTSALVFQTVKYAGVIYLLYLAWGMWRSSSVLSLERDKGSDKLVSIAFKGFLVNILNPKLTLFFVAFLPQFIADDTQQPVFAMLMLGLVFMLLTLVIFVLYGLLASQFRSLVIGSQRAAALMQNVFCASFTALAAKLAFTDRA